MADVRAEILAASRSRTGWLEGSVQNNEISHLLAKSNLLLKRKLLIKILN